MLRVLRVFVVTLASLAVLLVPAAASANTLVPECNNGDLANSSACKDVNDTSQTVTSNRFYGPGSVLDRVAGIIMYIGGVASVIMIILGGFTFMTGSGDPNTLAAARKTVIYAVVGIIVLVLPSAIVRFVISKL